MFVRFLNQKRKEAKVPILAYEQKLELSAEKRGEIILKYDDFSFEATKSGYTIARAMLDSGYSNTTYGEAPRLGYYDADELIENQFEFPETRNFLLNPNYDDLGISEVEGTLNGCPTQVIVLHFAGYIPPNYNQADIDSWKSLLSNLREVYPSWEKIKGYSLTYTKNKQDADRLLEIMSYRMSMTESIISKMENRQWLSSKEQAFIDKEDLSLFNEQQEIAKRLNSFRWQH